MSSLFWLLVGLVIVDAAVNEKCICTSNHTIEIANADSVVFFESPDFPQSLTEKEISNCYINFTKSLEPGETDKKFVLVIANPLCEDIHQDCDSFYDVLTNSDSNFFSFSDYYNNYTTLAFQGYTYYDDWADDCPFESMSRVDPFKLTDISQIIALWSTYTPGIVRRQSCIWKFKAPEGYGFKVVITYLNIDYSTIFKIQNSHDLIIEQNNHTKARITYPYYTTDNYIQIYLSENKNSTWLPYIDDDDDGNSGYVPEFMGYVTIIKNNFEEVSIDCISSENSTYISWSFTNEAGYPNHAKCSYIFTIFPNTEILVEGQRVRLEDGVDFISFYDYNNSMEIIHEQPNSLRHSQEIVLSPGDNNTERMILCEFKSDGSIVSQGFEMIFQKINCACANPNIIIPCSEKFEFYLMKLLDPDYDNPINQYYCGNLNCNYTFQLEPFCSKQFISFLFDYSLYAGTEYNVFKIFSNNELLFLLNYENWGNDKVVIIPAGNYNIFQAITVSTTAPKFLVIVVSAFDIETILPTASLNMSKPYSFRDFSSDDLNTLPNMMQIELSSELIFKNATIDIFLFNTVSILQNNIQFYTNTNLTQPLNFRNCFVEISLNTYKCKTNLQSLVVIQIFIVIDIFVQATIDDIPLNSEGCRFKHKNIVNFFATEIPHTAMSNEKSSCKIFFYNQSLKIYIKNFWTNPNSNGTINIFGGKNEKLLASIDTETASSWYNIYSNFYLIEIPINTTIMLSSHVFTQHPNISTYPYISVVTSDFFGTDYVIEYTDSYTLAKYNVYDYDIKFTLLELDVLEPNSFYFLQNDTRFNITSTFESIVFPPGDIEIWCSCSSTEHCVIRLLIETLDNSPPSTSSPSTILETTITSTTPQFITTETSISSFNNINHFFIIIQIFALFYLI